MQELTRQQEELSQSRVLEFEKLSLEISELQNKNYSLELGLNEANLKISNLKESGDKEIRDKNNEIFKLKDIISGIDNDLAKAQKFNSTIVTENDHLKKCLEVEKEAYGNLLSHYQQLLST